MSLATHASPSSFTAEESAARMSRVVEQASERGLDGVVVAPGRISCG